MNRYFTILCLTLLVSISNNKKANGEVAIDIPKLAIIDSLISKVNADSINASLYRLQGFGNRMSLADSSYAASEWICGKFSDYGYAASYDSFYMEYKYNYPDTTYLIRSGFERNVIGTKPGQCDPNMNIISCAHYDAPHVDCNDLDSLYLYPTPAAYDNGSGTASMLEISRVLKNIVPKKNLLFIGFTGEECGFPGSNHYADMAESTGMEITCLVDADVIGRYPDLACQIISTQESSAGAYFKEVAAKYVPDVKIHQSLGVSSNATSFYYNQGYVNCVNVYDTLPISGPLHTTHDSACYLYPEAIAKYTQIQVAGLALMAISPEPVDFNLQDIGDGSHCLITWPQVTDTAITQYKICYGTTSGSFSDTLIATDLAKLNDTLDNLKTDSIYYVIVWAFDSEGIKSLYSEIKQIIPHIIPASVQQISALPVYQGIMIKWAENPELDIAGYRIFRAVNDTLIYDSLNTWLNNDTTYIDSVLSGANKYYYTIKAVDVDNNCSPLSIPVSARPITLDQGVLVVDETNNWTTGSLPWDAQQDSFYNYILAGYKITGYEYGLTDPKPILADFGPYSTVAWFADDYVTMLASGAAEDMKRYLDNGGKLWLAGWKPSGNLHNITTYPANYTFGDIMYDNFKIGHTELSGTADSFKTAIGLKGYPDIGVDTVKYPASTLWGKTFRYVEALTPLAGADTIYVMDMKNNGSLFEGKACAVRDSGKTVFFGFPMYFMDKEQAKLVAQKVMAEFGEPLGVTGKPENRELINDIRLFQNVPNPFKNQTAISYQLPKAGQVKLNIYNIAGQLVKTLVNGNQAAGSHVIKWDGLDDNGLKVSNGVYVYKLEAAGIKGTKKMLLLR